MSATTLQTLLGTLSMFLLVSPWALGQPGRQSTQQNLTVDEGVEAFPKDNKDDKDFDFATGSCVDGTGSCSAESSFLASLSYPLRRSGLLGLYPGDDGCKRPRIVLARLSQLILTPGMTLANSRCQPLEAWLPRGLWLSDSAEFAVVDQSGARLLLFDPNGNNTKIVEELGGIGFDVRYPRALTKLERGYLALMSDNKVLWLDEALDPRSESELKAAEIGSIYEWEGGDDYFVAYGSLQASEATHGFVLGFIRVGVREVRGRVSLGRGVMLREHKNNRPYLVGGKNIAEVKGKLYYLAIDSTSEIYEASMPPRRLNAFPESYRVAAPEFEAQSIKDTETVYANLEKWTGPSGLYSDGEYLYLLTRRPGRAESTRWDLHQIDPEADRLMGSVTLPTRAPHILVLPGPSSWLVFEKGRVLGWGRQLVTNVVILGSLRARSVEVRQAASVDRKEVCSSFYGN